MFFKYLLQFLFSWVSAALTTHVLFLQLPSFLMRHKIRIFLSFFSGFLFACVIFFSNFICFLYLFYHQLCLHIYLCSSLLSYFPLQIEQFFCLSLNFLLSWSSLWFYMVVLELKIKAIASS